MKKKQIQMVVLWLALFALAWVYTDRDAYTWRFDGEALVEIVSSAEEAAQAQMQAQEDMARRKQEAKLRADHGEWGSDLQSEEQEIRSAQDIFGLNLMWGDYRVTLHTSSVQPLDVYVVSAGAQSFITGGTQTLPAGQDMETTFDFALTDSTQGVRLCVSSPESVTAVTVKKLGMGVISRDLLAYAVLCGIVLSTLLVLSWDTRPVGRARRRDAWAIVCTALFASLPLFWGGLVNGHDLFFHLNRIEGIASALRGGQFPVRIHASTIQGYGYAASEFYPELFLYLPALMRNAGVSLAACLRVFELSINLLSALSAYLCAKAVFDSRRTAVGTSVLYTLCIYRLSNLYTRATLGESLAMLFFPLLIWALVEVLRRDERRWPLLALAMTGICMSHLLSTLFAFLFCVLAALLSLPQLVRAPRRLLAIFKAAVLTALCSVWFFVPMLDYVAAGISTSVIILSSDHVLRLGSYLVGFSGDMSAGSVLEDYAYTIGVVPGLALMVGCALLLLRRYMRGREGLQAQEASNERLSLTLLGLGVLALLCATDLFPWAMLCGMARPVSTFFMQIQFPWRLVSVAAPMLAMAAAWGYLGDARYAKAGMALLCTLSVVFGGYTLQSIVQQEPVLYAESFCDTRIGQYEYTYAGTEKEALEPGDIRFDGITQYDIADYRKRGTTLDFTLTLPNGPIYMELPLLYYPGYEVTINGEARRVERGTNNLLRVYGVGYGEQMQVHAAYHVPTQWLAAQGVSVLGAALLAFVLLRMRKRT